VKFFDNNYRYGGSERDKVESDQVLSSPRNSCEDFLVFSGPFVESFCHTLNDKYQQLEVFSHFFDLQSFWYHL